MSIHINRSHCRAVVAATLFFFTTAAFAQNSPRQRVSINANWKFFKDNTAQVGPGFAGGGGGRGAPAADANAIAADADKLSYARIKDWMLATGLNLVRDADAPRQAHPAGNLGDDVPQTKADFNDSAWRTLSLPHDWGIEGPFRPDYPGSTGRLPFWGVAWYRKTIEVLPQDAGLQFFLDIDGAMAYPNVWCNGQYAGGWGYGYASFRIDLTPYIKPGQQNVIAIRLDNPPNSSRWYPGGGIYRNVWLTKTAPVHVGQWGTYLTTPEITAAAAPVDLKVTLDNASKADASVVVSSQIFAIDANDQRVGAAVATTPPVTIQIGAGKSEVAATKTSVNNPKLWSIETPNRYVAVTTVQQNGNVVDQYETPFGIRTLKFDPTTAFSLNGKQIKLNGVCNHHDLGALGAAINVRGLERQIELLKEMGCNSIRTSHNPPAPELLDLCDKMGIVVMDETFDCWREGKTANDYHWLFDDWSERDTRMLVRRDRNHPSVIMWSIGNEVNEQGRGEAGAAMAARLSRIVREEDPTRVTTAACNNAQPGSPFLAAIDAVGLNYQGSRPSAQRPYGNYEPAHQSRPNQMIFGTETASTISTRGVYTFPVAQFPGAISGGGGRRGGGGPPPGQDVANHQMSSYDLYYPSWATSPDTEFSVQDRFPYVGGEFVWTGFDYLGEPTPWGGGGGGGRGGRGLPAPNDPMPEIQPGQDTARSSYFGIIDLAGFKKDRFFIYQAHWRPELPMAHILPHWNWPDRVGEVTPVHVYTSGDEAELFLNGKSQGRLKKEQYTYRIRWDEVKYEPGEVKVVAYKAGKEWATETVKTTGAPSKLTLKPDRTTITSDGSDLSFVTVSVADSAGLMVPRSMNLLKFEISGPGEIVAVDNGDPTSLDSFQAKQMKAFNGLCLVIVRSKWGQQGNITLKATSEGLSAAETTITTATK